MFDNLNKQNQTHKSQQLIDLIKEHVKKGMDENLTFEDFQTFLKGMQKTHKKCGKDCVHLMRFYMRLGFVPKKYFLKKKSLKLAKPNLHPFKK